jgi:hypothetical protein
MDSWSTVLDTADMDSRGVEVDLQPAKVNKLTDSQGMPECHEDQEPIADRVAAVAGGGDQAVDLARRRGLMVISLVGDARWVGHTRQFNLKRCCFARPPQAETSQATAL